MDMILKYWDQFKVVLFAPATALGVWAYKRREKIKEENRQEINQMKAQIGNLEDDVSIIHKDLETVHTDLKNGTAEFGKLNETLTGTNLKLEKVLGYLDGKSEK